LYFVLPVELLAAYLVLQWDRWDTRGWAWWAITVQLTGAVITFGGLLYAYLRADPDSRVS
jgi:hypothetical protein